MRRQQYNNKRLRRKKKDKKKDNDNRVPHLLPIANRKAWQRYRKQIRKKE